MMKILLVIASLLVSASCIELQPQSPPVSKKEIKLALKSMAMYDKAVNFEKEQRGVEAKLLEDVKHLTEARDRLMDGEENEVPMEKDISEAENALTNAMTALAEHQKRLSHLHSELQTVTPQLKSQQSLKKVGKSTVPLSLFEEVSGKQQTKLHHAEVRELFVAAKKEGHESLSEKDLLNTLTVPGVPMDICEEATRHIMGRVDADHDGQISRAEALKFVQEDSAQLVSQKASSMLQKTEEAQESAASQVEQMKANATMTLMKIMQEQEAKEDAKRMMREMRWKKMLERQKASLAEREKALKRQQKELDRLDREERWQNSEAKKKTTSFLEKKACEQNDIHAFLTTPNTAHAKCLKLQLGECADATQVQVPSLLECNENSNGWQKKCMNDRVQEAGTCAPAGVNWEALKKGETGTKMAVDNMAIQKLQGWCTLYTSLQQVSASSPQWAAVLDQDATVSNDFMSKIQDFVRQSADTVSLVQIDPNDSPHSVAVRADSAAKILNLMTAVPAMPISDLITALNQQSIPTTKMEAGLAGVIDASLLQNAELATNGLLCSPRRL